jgi:signal transduction histidine kinase/DNA-binding response OmpR family regulator
MQEVSPEIPVEGALRILLVEDSRLDAELIVRCLHRDGLVFTHRRVETANLLVRALAEFDPDILLCDNRLPNLDAVSVIEIVVGIRPHLPIIIVTGTLDDEAAAGLIKAGAVDFIRKDRLGRLPVAVTSALDTTRAQKARSEQEAELRESEIMLRLALGATGQGVWRWEVSQGADGFKWDGPCSALLGLDYDTPINYAVWANAIHVADRVAALDGMDLALDPTNTQDDYVCDFRVLSAVGSEIWLAAAGRAMFEPDPALPAGRKSIRILGTIRDVSRAKSIEQEREATQRELETAREAAEQASRAKSRFLATVTHDLRTPLHGILGYAELLTLEGDLNGTQLERLEAIANAGRGLLGTINAVLDMSQIEADRMELSPVGIDLPDLIRGCLDVVRPAAEAKGLSLTAAPAEQLRVIADPGRLRQVLINLLGNAIKFTPAGSVEVRLQQTGAAEFVRLQVADTGPGVWARHRQKLFNPFERLNAEAMSGIEGSGLGLAIAARLVRLMGGRIGYDDNPGGGSVFWVELPSDVVGSVEVKVVAPRPLAGTRCLRVLVVDDDALNRNIASGFLSIAGHDVVCVDSGAAAVEAAATADFDVILMDVRMPGMTGLEATRLIRALPPPRCEVQIVAVTAQAFAEQVETCRQSGMNGHVSKPFKQAVLLAALENVTMAPNNMERAAMPRPAAQAAAQPELPILDEAAFEDVADSLSAAVLRQHLQTLIGRCEALLRALHGAEMLSQASELAEIAHKLAGGGGTFGFLHLAAAARRFERAVASSMADAPVLAGGLSAAIEASLPTMRERALVDDLPVK